jgi:hypothetical protein
LSTGQVVELLSAITGGGEASCKFFKVLLIAERHQDNFYKYISIDDRLSLFKHILSIVLIYVTPAGFLIPN